MVKHAAKIGALSYALWSILHIVLGISRLMERHSGDALAEAAGRLAQGHWTLLYLGIFGLIVSVFNWRGNKTAYWVNGFMISAEDIGFLIFPIYYGGLGLPAAAIGPGLWIVGLAFTTIAYFGTPGGKSPESDHRN